MEVDHVSVIKLPHTFETVRPPTLHRSFTPILGRFLWPSAVPVTQSQNHLQPSTAVPCCSTGKIGGCSEQRDHQNSAEEFFSRNDFWFRYMKIFQRGLRIDRFNAGLRCSVPSILKANWDQTCNAINWSKHHRILFWLTNPASGLVEITNGCCWLAAEQILHTSAVGYISLHQITIWHYSSLWSKLCWSKHVYIYI